MALYAELAAFEGNACQHVADWQERNRLERIKAGGRRTIERRTGGRSGHLWRAG